MRAGQVFALAVIGAAVIPLSWPQQGNNKPLGDVAREQRQTRKLRGKESSKIYSSDDLKGERIVAESANPATPASTDSKLPAPSSAVSPPATAADAKPQEPVANAEPATDEPKDTADEVLIVPAGAKIRVNVSSPPHGPFPPLEGTVTLPVQVGSAVAIPAQAKVILASSRSTNGGAYVWVAVTAVTLGGATYKVHTNARQLPISRAITELTFTVSKPLSLP